eukprot:scaffold37405_cov69-Attheya_sp.AAC.2
MQRDSTWWRVEQTLLHACKLPPRSFVRDTTQISLIFACREENDLLMRSTLDKWAEKFPNKFKIHYILSDKWPADWKYSSGFVSRPLFEAEFHPPAKDYYNLMCGPPIMIDRGCIHPTLLPLVDTKRPRLHCCTVLTVYRLGYALITPYSRLP